MERKKLTDKNRAEFIKKAIDYLERSHAIIFPVDTMYALGVDAFNESAIKRLFSLKKRSREKPVPLFVSDVQMAHEIAFINRDQEEIIRKLWPGPFTLVLEKRKRTSSLLSAGTDKIGLRVSNSNFVQKLVSCFGRPITASSANISGMISSKNLDEILEQFRQKSMMPEFVIDDGDLEEKDPATVIDITGPQPKILRINQASLPKLQKIFDNLTAIS